jgi:hypothetical protein
MHQGSSSQIPGQGFIADTSYIKIVRRDLIQYLWGPSMELSACHPSGAQKFEAALRIFGKFVHMCHKVTYRLLKTESLHCNYEYCDKSPTTREGNSSRRFGSSKSSHGITSDLNYLVRSSVTKCLNLSCTRETNA